MSRRTEKGSSARLYVGFIVLITIVICSFVIYSRWSSADSVKFSALYSKMKTWVDERRQHLEKVSDTIRTVPSNNTETESEPQIHFEFYTALPNMQIAGSDLVGKKNQNAKEVSPVKEKDE